jgi:hypothetical protein
MNTEFLVLKCCLFLKYSCFSPFCILDGKLCHLLKGINLMFKSKSRMKQKVDIVHFIKVGIIFVQQHEDYCINLKECDNKK